MMENHILISTLASIIVLTFSLYFSRNWIKHQFYRFLDNLSYKNFLQFFKIPMFSKGWGNGDRYQKLEKYLNHFPKYPHDIKVDFFDEFERDGNILKSGKFVSPLADLLREGEKNCHFQYVIPKKDKEISNANKSISIVPPTAGQQGYNFRYKNIGKELLKRGIHYLAVIPPCYKFRRSADQRAYGISWQAVNDAPITMCAHVAEVRSIVKYCIEKLGYGKVCLSGMSMAGGVTSIASRFEFYDKEKQRKQIPLISCVSYIGNFSMDSPVLKATSDLEGLEKKEIPKELKELKIVTKKGAFEKAVQIYDHFMFPPNLDTYKTDIHNYIITFATEDKVITKIEQKKILVFCKKNLKMAGKDVSTRLETRVLKGGHFFGFAMSLMGYNFMLPFVQSIIDSFEKMKEDK